MSKLASSAITALISAAAGSTTVVHSEWRKNDITSQEPSLPYFRLSFLRMNGKTKVHKRLRGVCLIECYADSNAKAWDLLSTLITALGLDGGVMQAPGRPSAISDFNLDDPGMIRGNTATGGLVYCNVIFNYFK